MPLKVIRHREAIAKVGIQRVLYRFCLALLLPFFAFFLEKDAFRVSFTECVEVAKFATGDKDIDLHDVRVAWFFSGTRCVNHFFIYVLKSTK